jgi:hypothetical protein
MPKLTDTQLMLLSKATQQDGIVLIPAKLKGAAAVKVIKPLLARGFLQEVPSQPGTPAWRRDEGEGQSYALMITREGRAAINAEDEGERAEPPKPDPKPRRAAKPAGRGRATRQGAKREAAGSTPRPGSKLAKVIAMLDAKAGATIDALVKATDWLPHTTRAALTGLRKRGYEIAKDRTKGRKTAYRIVSASQRGRRAAKAQGRKA